MSDEKHAMCSLSSVFLPTTQCHAIAALGKDYAKRRRTWVCSLDVVPAPAPSRVPAERAGCIPIPHQRQIPIPAFAAPLTPVPARQNAPEPPNPAVTLDYRCHAPGGTIGKGYPPTVSKCLGKLAEMRTEAIKQEYGVKGNWGWDISHNISRTGSWQPTA